MVSDAAYTVRRVDGLDPAIARVLLNLHEDVFGQSAPHVAVWDMMCWLVRKGLKPVGFALLNPMPAANKAVSSKTGYLSRSGVLWTHRGHGLQRRLIHARVAAARRLGLTRLVSDTNDNPASGRSLERCGFMPFQPAEPWAFSTSTYWEKRL